MVLGVARDANRAAGVGVYLAQLAALHTHRHTFDLEALWLLHLLLRDHNGVGSSAPTKDTSALGLGTHIEDLGAKRDHVNGQTIASRSRLRCQHTGIDDTAHACYQVFGDTGSVALDLVALTHAICGDNIRLFARLYAGDEGQVGAAIRVVFDAVHDVLAREVPFVVDNADAPLVAAASVSYGDLAAVVPASEMLALPSYGELQMRPPLPQMVVYWSFQVA